MPHNDEAAGGRAAQDTGAVGRGGNAAKRSSRKDSSLGVLAQGFVRLFLHAPGGVVSLELAAQRLMHLSQEP